MAINSTFWHGVICKNASFIGEPYLAIPKDLCVNQAFLKEDKPLLSLEMGYLYARMQSLQQVSRQNAAIKTPGYERWIDGKGIPFAGASMEYYAVDMGVTRQTISKYMDRLGEAALIFSTRTRRGTTESIRSYANDYGSVIAHHARRQGYVLNPRQKYSYFPVYTDEKAKDAVSRIGLSNFITYCLLLDKTHVETSRYVDGWGYPLQMSQSNIARLLGITPDTVKARLRRLHEYGFLRHIFVKGTGYIYFLRDYRTTDIKMQDAPEPTFKTMKVQRKARRIPVKVVGCLIEETEGDNDKQDSLKNNLGLPEKANSSYPLQNIPGERINPHARTRETDLAEEKKALQAKAVKEKLLREKFPRTELEVHLDQSNYDAMIAAMLRIWAKRDTDLNAFVAVKALETLARADLSHCARKVTEKIASGAVRCVYAYWDRALLNLLTAELPGDRAKPRRSYGTNRGNYTHTDDVTKFEQSWEEELSDIV